MKTLKTLTIVATLALITSAASAEVLLKIDISDASAVIFTATDGKTSSASSGYNSETGINLIDFFTGNTVSIDEPAPNSSDLMFLGAHYPNINSDPDYTFNSRNLNMYFVNSVDFDFDAGVTVFTGTATFDMSLSTNLPAIGHIGDLQGGDSTPTGPVFGQYEIVPEPATMGLLGLGGLALLRRRRR